jgi:hypothetical protein
MNNAGKSTEATDFYISAKGFKEAAKYIHGNPSSATNPGLIFLPMQTLVGFSFELYFKAWLSQTGVTKDVIRKKYGHNLQALLQDSYGSGLVGGRKLQETIDTIAGSHGDYTYRYFDSSRQYQAMGLMTVLDLLDGLDVETDTAIGVSSSAGLAPGH